MKQNEQKINRTLLGELLNEALNEAEDDKSFVDMPRNNSRPLNDEIIILNTTELGEVCTLYLAWY